MVSFKKIDNFYVWGIKGIIFLMPFIPLYVSPSIVFPYITGKNFAFRIMVECAAALWLGLIYTNKEYRLRNSPITLSILLFTFIVGLADIFGVNPYKSFWSNYERMEGYITILHLALYFMILKSVVRTKKEWMILLNIVVVVSFLVSIFALSASLPDPNSSRFSIEYANRVYGTIGNPPFLASYLLLCIFACLILIVNTNNLYLKLVYLFPVIVNTVTIYFSASRGAILAMFIGAMVLSLAYILGSGVSREKIIKKAVLLAIGMLIVLSVSFMTFRNTELIKHNITLSRFVDIFSDASVQTRFRTWKLAWEGVKERPVLGWGQENFIGVYMTSPIPLTGEGQIWVDRAHNIVIDWLINAGIIGLFSYMAIFGTAFYVLWGSYHEKRVSKNEALIIGIAIAVYFFHNLFTFDTINTYLLFFTLLVYIDSFDYPESLADISSEKNILPKATIISASAGLLALLVISGTSYFVNFRPIKESQLFLRIARNDSFTMLLDDYNNALSVQSFGDSLVRQGMMRMSFIITQKRLFAHEGAMKFIEVTLSEWEKEIAANPNDLESLTDLISYYMQIAQYVPSFYARTESLIRTCMQLNPEYEWPYMVLTDLYILRKDYELAYDNVQKIVDSDPHNDKKQFKLALTAILVSREDDVNNALENVMKIRNANNTAAYETKSIFSFDELYQIAIAYKKADNLQKALYYYKKLISILPVAYEYDFPKRSRPRREAKIHFETALIYNALGDNQNALSEAQKAVELDPMNYAGAAEQIKSLNN